MTSQQIAANCANAELSTGPITEAGKEAVSRNALKHGLSGATHAALPGEESALEKHCEGYREAYAPVGAPEHDLVRNIAENHWRLKRAHAMESALFFQLELAGDLDAPAAHAEGFIDPVKGLQRIALYAARIQRAIEKNAAELKAMQDARKAAPRPPPPREEAILLTQLAQMQGKTIEPERDFPADESLGGFVYSASEIARLIDRARRLEEASARFRPAA